jgi:hypothetical protein
MKTVKTKKILLVQPGPLHLFFATGVYYLWELKDKYDFVLLVTYDYLNSLKFIKIIKHLEVKYIYYQGKDKGFKLIKNLHNDYSKILKIYNPDKILMHNTCFIENQILLNIYDSNNKSTEIFEYQNSKAAQNIVKDRQREVYIETNNFANKYKYLKKIFKILIIFIRLKNLLKYLYYYKIIPYLIVGKTFNPHFNIYTGKHNKKKSYTVYRKVIKRYFAYLEYEAVFASKSGVENFEIINHPLGTSGRYLNKILYNRIIEKNQILILPSGGLLEKELVKNNNYAILSEFIANQYVNFLNILLAKFPNFNIKFKLHPRSESYSIWIKIIKLISEKNYNIALDKSSNAEQLILESKIIVSETSSVLWWSMFLGDKINISLDIFNFETGKEMSSYSSEIYYINDLKKLKKIKLIPKKIIRKDRKNISQVL